MAENSNGAFIWSIANLLRGVYKQADYGKVILPFTVLRRLDAVLEPTKDEVLAAFEKRKNQPGLDHILPTVSKQAFFNSSKFTLAKLLGDPANLRANLLDYVEGFSPNVKDIFERYDFAVQLSKLEENDLLFLVLKKFAAVDLHPDRVSNTDMGLVFEELIRKFAEASNETAGEHFTPREVVGLIVSLLFTEHPDENPARSLTVPGAVRTVYDPAAGTGGMLSVADDYAREHFPRASLTLLGQELNAESFAIAKADMVIKGQSVENIVWGDTLTNDGHLGKTFDFGISNPPFGVEWKKQLAFVQKEYQEQGYDGRFGPGLPRVSDGSLLFLQHLVQKMRPKRDGGGRVGIVLNGSVLAIGGAGSGESEIRRYLFSNDLVDAIIALPSDMFYNTDISTYVWILDNDKPRSRLGTVQLVDASADWVRLKKLLGKKSRRMTASQIADVVRTYAMHEESPVSRIMRNDDFAYTTVTVERPMKRKWTIPENLNELLAGHLEGVGKEQVGTAAHSLKIELENLAELSDARGIEDAVARALHLTGIDAKPAVLRNILTLFSYIDQSGEIVLDRKRNPVPDPKLRDVEKVPMTVDIDEFFAARVSTIYPDAWLDRSKDKVGYEVAFTKIFYKPTPRRPLAEIDQELATLADSIRASLIDIGGTN